MRLKRNPEGGSVLVLVPAGFLVLIILAALAVDSAATYLGQQQLHDAVAAAANDAATAALDNAAFYRSGALTIDPASAARVVCQSVAAQADPGLHGIHLWVAVSAAAGVRVQGTATVDAIFGRALPGIGRRPVRALADAVAVRGSTAAPAPPSRRWGPLEPVRCPAAPVR